MTMAPLASGSSAAARAFDTARLFERLRPGVADLMCLPSFHRHER